MIDREALEMIAEIFDQKLEANNAKLEARLEASMDRKLGNLESRMDEKLSKLESRMDEKLNTLESRMDEKLNTLESRMDGKLTSMEKSLYDHISLTEANLNKSIAQLSGRVTRLEDGLREVNFTLETDIKPDIKLLTEVFIPAARRMQKVTSEFEHMQASIQVLNLTVMKHSEQLAKIS